MSHLGFHGAVRVNGDATYLSQNVKAGGPSNFHAYEDKNAQETAPEMSHMDKYLDEAESEGLKTECRVEATLRGR